MSTSYSLKAGAIRRSRRPWSKVSRASAEGHHAPTRTEATPSAVLHPIRELLRYIARHRAYALTTVFFGTMGFLLAFAYPWLIGSVIDVVASADLPFQERKARLVHLVQLSVLTAVGHAVVVYGRGHFNVHLGHRVVSDLRQNLFEHLQTLSLRFFGNERMGSILARMLHDVQEATSLIYMGLIVAALDTVQLAIAIALLANVSGTLTIACLALFPLYGLVFAGMNPRVRRASERMQNVLTQIAGNLSEQLAGQAVVKTYTAEPREAKRFSNDLRHHHRLVVDQSHNGHVVAAFGEVLVHFGTTIVIGYGGWLALHGKLTPGQVTRFLGYMLIMFGPVRRLAELNITYQTSLSAMRRVFRLLEVRPSIVEPTSPRTKPPSRGHIQFEHVCFRYDDRSDEACVKIGDDGRPEQKDGADRPSTSGPWILDGVSLEVRPGERMAIVGPSGAGKTTLVSLVPRLYDVTSGRLLIDGTDVRDYSLSALRSEIGIVQQDSFVFSGSIRDNIAYGRPDATDQEIIEAALAANAHDFILRQPDGYSTQLGERGVNLSGGQRQRLSVARALLKNPRILILDEATSSLDVESEALVQQALERLMRGRTCLIVAHRLSTIRNADRTVVLENGHLAESGTHEELLARGGVYARLVRYQTLSSKTG